MTSKPRSRVVVFRLSQDEYWRLREACERHGGRNLSDFTRSEILDYLESGTLDGRLQRCFSEIDQRITALQSDVARLMNLMDGYFNVANRLSS